MKISPQKNRNGFTLVEVMVSLAIISVLILGVYSLIILSLRITADNKNYVTAMEIANQKMEQIRNMPYNNVGTITGVPSGIIPQAETIERGGSFTVDTSIIVYNDSYDDVSGSDSIPNDYKIATIKISWESSYGPKNLSISSKIISKTKEVESGYGLLELHSVDSNGAPVPDAKVYIDNDVIVPPIHDYTKFTDANGILNFGMIESFQNYKITVSKPGYSTSTSFDVSSGMTPIHLSITKGNKTAESFSIDRLATLIIKTYSDNTPINWMVNKATSTSDKSKTNISKDDFGNIYFAWQDKVDTTNSSVYIQKYDSTKTRQWTNDVRAETSKNETNPSLATGKNGTSYLVWQDSSITLKSVAIAPNEPRNILKNSTIANDDSSKRKEAKISLIAVFNDRLNELINSYSGKLKEIFFTDIRNLSKAVIVKIKNYFNGNNAVASGAVIVVQTKISANVDNSKTLTAAFDNTPANGNVIIAVAVHRNDLASFSVPTNSAGAFTVSAYSDNSASLDTGIWHRVAGVNEPKEVAVTSSDDITGGVLMLMEISGLETTDLSDVASVNHQSDFSKTGDTGLTASSTNNSFGIAAVAFADRSFVTPTSADWHSSSINSFTHQLWDDWNNGNDGSLGVATIHINASAPQKATLGPLSGGSNTNRNSVLAIFKIRNDTVATSLNSQTISITAPGANQYIGGSFIFAASSTNSVNSIKMTEKGTVDAQNNLENIKLYYDIDNSAPYDCAGESYADTDLQFGTAQNFNSVDGDVTFVKVGGATIDATHTFCAYGVLDVKNTANKDDTIEIEITNPATDIVISSGVMTPTLPVTISGTTNILKPAELQQIHHRFRNDDGDEMTASWSEIEDNDLIAKINTIARLRFQISNEGSFDSLSTAFQIEYGEKDTACSAIATWHPLPTDNSLAWKVSDSSNINDGDPTTNVGGIFDENTIFKTSQIKDSGNQTAPLTLASSDFTEIEYSLEATGNATEKAYCFRLTNAGATAQFNYVEYPEISIVGDDNIFIKSFDSSGNEIWGAKRVHLDASSANQQNPQIAMTENFGEATTTVVWEDSRNGNIDIYGQSFDRDGNRLWGTDLRISDSPTNEISPVVGIDPGDNIYVSWEEQGDIYLQKYSLDGVELWTDPLNITNSSDSDFSPKINHASNTGMILAWTTLESSAYNSYLAKFDSGGNLIWKQKVNSESDQKNQFYPSLISDDSDIYITWTDDRNGNDNIYAQKFDFAGVLQWPKDQKITDDTDSSEQNSSAIAINSDSKIFSAWHDERNLSKEVYAAEIGEPTTPTATANVPLTITGSKQIYKNPIQYKYDRTHVTDASGDLSLQLEWDTAYQIFASSTLTALRVTECRPVNCPISISAGEIKSIEIYVK